ncbi:MAG: dipeptidase PepE [Terriglobales bacterium]
MRLLLLSTSTLYGSGYLDYAEAHVREFLGKSARVLFVPYALQDRDGYAESARQRFERMGYELYSIHQEDDPARAVGRADFVFIGGGNTFRLLKTLYDESILELIAERVREGLPYIGSSAGTNMVCPTIKTTNDMPIVEPASFKAMGLLPFQINPHYLDPDPNSKHMGETREERLRQYLEENDVPVIGLREGSLLWVKGKEITLRGEKTARVFRRGEEAIEISAGAKVDEALLPPCV